MGSLFFMEDLIKDVLENEYLTLEEIAKMYGVEVRDVERIQSSDQITKS